MTENERAPGWAGWRWIALISTILAVASSSALAISLSRGPNAVVQKLIQAIQPSLIPQAMIYRYYSIHWDTKLTISVDLISAQTTANNSHAAVWIGAQTPNAKQWVQAGVAFESGIGLPFAYIESNAGHGRLIKFSSLPWTMGSPIQVRLERRHGMWRAGVDGLWTPWRHLTGVIRCSLLELMGSAHATALIDGRTVMR
jgi:hypothetical protein